MKVYNYDGITKEYLGVAEAAANPLEAGEFLIPANATQLSPPQADVTEAAVFNSDEWEIKADYRGTDVWNKATQEKSIINEIGDVPEAFTTEPPPSAYHKWSDSEGTYVADTSKKQELLQLLKAKIDVETDENILNGFLYEDKSVKLSLENQMNYKAEYDMRELLTYPHKIKADNEYVMLESSDEYAAFYVAGVQYIRTCIETGWTEKDALDTKTTTELIDYMNNS
ncbi:MAG: hypothetical protein GY742_22920 [Hyphomicrobiales bacterium]|nr:hypothetical protein [Hyphomicrobiales bacterium]